MATGFLLAAGWLVVATLAEPDAGRTTLISGSLKRIGIDRVGGTLVAEADRLQRSTLAAVQPQALRVTAPAASAPDVPVPE
ncbi:hypothetical protein [Actinomadura sp. 6N118]|uniref:hypothetical protein n=1 Tax=Actinomadura sp. 6N118 TaxID=3375151 RepID=UPI0037B7C5E8